MRIEKPHRHLDTQIESMAAGLPWLGQSQVPERDLPEVEAQGICGWQNNGLPKISKS